MQNAIARLKEKPSSLLGLCGVQAVMAYAWLEAGWEKVSDPEFANGMGKTLGYFASKNPIGWYKAFLLGPATDKSYLFGLAVEWGEVFAGLALLASLVGIACAASEKKRQFAFRLGIFALLAGAFMNANFYLAAGWTGPGTKGDNVVMFWSQAVLAWTWWVALQSKGGRQQVPRAD